MTPRRDRRRNAFIAQAMLALWLLMTAFNVVHACALQTHDGFGAAASVVAPQGHGDADHDALADGLCSAAEPAFAKAQTPDGAIAPAPLQPQPRAAWLPGGPSRASSRAHGEPPPPGAPLVIRLLRLTI
jgi:hypothetical protein